MDVNLGRRFLIFTQQMKRFCSAYPPMCRIFVEIVPDFLKKLEDKLARTQGRVRKLWIPLLAFSSVIVTGVCYAF